MNVIRETSEVNAALDRLKDPTISFLQQSLSADPHLQCAGW